MSFYTTTLPLTTDLIKNFTSYGVAPCNLPKARSLEDVSYAIYMILVLVSSVLGNCMVLLVVTMSSLLRSRVTFYFIASLACSDFALAIFQIPFRISLKLNHNRFCHELPACYIMLISDAFGNVASILNLFLISIDRFIAIKFPFRYNDLLSKTRVKYLISAVWIISALWAFTGIFNWKKKEGDSVFGISISRSCLNSNYYFYATSFFGIYIPVLVAITIAYLAILHVALTQIRAIEASTVALPTQRTLLNAGNNSPRTEKMNKRRKRTLNKELKATKSVAIVYLAFVICWLPSCVINIIIMIDNIFISMRSDNEKLFLFIYYFFIEILPNTNTMVNPLIYSFSNQQFRSAFKTVYFKLLGRYSNAFYSQQSPRTYGSADLSISASPSMSPYHGENQKMDTIAIWKPD
ncbi:adenosine receptor A2b-like [Hydractinia symbiolongicarpus]|uniref:adenosine receptor A2b-like n=1 Tax=Hydractinia symbiolongicarpus TaxID=13093 RepID=UPI00254D5C08|nr:adenosine receptor A2b-like [Hydractinia symbiolongicarpus]